MKKLALAAVSVAALALAGCAATPTGEGDGGIRVVASTSVYGSLAEQIGGDHVEVTSLITSTAQDPHSYEASARDRLAVQQADLVIENGGGYDAFIDTLLEGSDAAHVVTAVEFSHDFPGNEGHEADAEHGDHAHDHGDHEHIEGFNEHIWFDAHTMIHVVEAIAAELGELDPASADTFTANADEIVAELEGLEAAVEALGADAAGANVFLTEPLAGYLATGAGLTDVTPDGFAEAVEEGSDVAPAVLLAALDVIASGDVHAVLTNAQTGGAETERIEKAAADAGIPVVAFTELPEDGSSYAEWMHDAIASLAAALRS